MNINKKLIVCALVIILVLLLILTIYLLLIKPFKQVLFGFKTKEYFDTPSSAIISNNNQTSLTIKTKNMLPSNLNTIITDLGYLNHYQGLANLQGNNNELNDYIRYCGNDDGTLYTALYGDTTQYSTNEKVIDTNGKPYANGSNMPPYSLYNPNNNRTISLNSNYAVRLYNRLNGTTYAYNGKAINIEPQTITTTSTLAPTTSTLAPTTSTLAPTTSTLAPTTSTLAAPTSTVAATTSTLAPTTAKLNCSIYMGNILNTPQKNINNCNLDNNCYYLGGNCWDVSKSDNINNVDLTCSYTPKNPNSNSSPYILSLLCNNNNKDDKNYYIIQSINYKDANGNFNYLYNYNPSSNNIDTNSKTYIPYIYNGSMQNISDVSANTDQIDNIYITDIKGNTKNFKINNNSINNNKHQIISPNNSLLSQIQSLSGTINNNIYNSSS
jgi:hypothetical protein